MQLDLDFVSDFAEGELRSDMVKGRAVVQFMSNEDRSGTSTTRSRNYVVSLQELSLRLHEVIQSRLEERVQELESALQNSQRKVEPMKSEHKNSWNIYNNEWKHFSNLETPLLNQESDCLSKPLDMKLTREALDADNEAREELSKTYESGEEDSPPDIYQNNHRDELHMSWGDCLFKPLVMKLSGEALDAYHEARKELSKTDDSKEEGAAPDIYQNNHQDELHEYNQNMLWGVEIGVNDYLLHHPTEYPKNISEEAVHGEGRTLEEPPQRSMNYFDYGVK